MLCLFQIEDVILITPAKKVLECTTFVEVQVVFIDDVEWLHVAMLQIVVTTYLPTRICHVQCVRFIQLDNTYGRLNLHLHS